MYVTVREHPAVPLTGALPAEPARPRVRATGVRAVGRTVLALGLTSLFTDVSSEMVNAILPLYLVVYLQLSPLAFGVVDGLYQGAAALIRVASGYVADRWQRHKDAAVTGYALSALCKLLLLAAGSAWLGLAAVVLVDRTGKGIRTAPRDALISLTSSPAALATAFGVHRALDTVGALLGPLFAFALLSRLPSAFDAVFVVSFCFAAIGLGVLTVFVDNPASARDAARLESARRPTLRGAAGLLAAPGFRTLLLIGGALGLATVSDAFVYLILQRRLELPAGYFPLLFVATSLAYFLLAVPLGRLADRWGRGRTFLLGYALLLPVYGTLLFPRVGLPHLGLCLLLFGAYYAATDGVLMALASASLGAELRTTGLGLLTAVTSLARLVASVLFGAVWTRWGMETAVAMYTVALLAAIALAALALARRAGVARRARGAIAWAHE